MTSSGTGDTPTAPTALDAVAQAYEDRWVEGMERGIAERYRAAWRSFARDVARSDLDRVLGDLEAAVPGDGPLCIVDGRLVRAEPIDWAAIDDEHLWRISGTGQ